jgi:hypothetical protein
MTQSGRGDIPGAMLCPIMASYSLGVRDHGAAFVGVRWTMLSREPDKNEEFAMGEAFSGSYPIESRGGEIERLHI